MKCANAFSIVSDLSAEGMAGDTGLTQESSQFSSECIATQVRIFILGPVISYITRR